MFQMEQEEVGADLGAEVLQWHGLPCPYSQTPTILVFLETATLDGTPDLPLH